MTAQQLCDNILRIMDRVKACHLQEAEKHNLTKVQVFALYSIARHGELPMGQVAHVLHCDASNVTGIVDRMVTQGLIERHECPTDRRAKRLKLTEKGQQIVQDLQGSLPGCTGVGKLTADERETLSYLLQKMDA